MLLYDFMSGFSPGRMLRLLLPVVFFFGGLVWAQEEGGRPLSDREYRYQKMEERALNLSRRLSAISGSDPIELIDRNQSFDPVYSESAAQYTFDSLPGPVDKVEPLPTYEEANMSASPAVYRSEVSRVVPTTQQRKGDYYFMPFAGFNLSSETMFSINELGNASDELEGVIGNLIGIAAGKRWDNWLASLRIFYSYNEFKNDNFTTDNQERVSVTANQESYSMSLNFGYSIPLSYSLSTYGVVGLGGSFRKNSAFPTLHSPVLGDISLLSVTDSSLVLSYDFSMGFEYLFNSNYSVLLGYRLLGLSSNESFEGSFQHLIELGVGANF
jgi:opacity protein-like surface antigen